MKVGALCEGDLEGKENQKKRSVEQTDGVDCVENYTERPLEIGGTFKRKTM